MKINLLDRNLMRIMAAAMISFMVLLTGLNSFGQTITTNTQGMHEGYFYSFWNDGQRGSASMTLGPDGNYSTTWTNINNFTAGKGWKVGKPDRTVCFEGTYNGGSNGFLAVYGWTKDPLIEYYVVESYGNWIPPGNTSDVIFKGTLRSDGGEYRIYVSTRTNQPSIIGTATFQQYWSVRTERRSSGTVTFKNHVDKWAELGMPLGGTWDYQIMESEGYQSTGNSNITVKECNACNTAAPTVPSAVITYEQFAQASPLTASGTSLKWYTVESGGTALPSAPTPNTSVLGTTTYYVGQTLNGCEGPRTAVRVNVVNTYKIYKAPSPVSIDGVIDAVWNHASVLPAAATKVLSGTVSNVADLSGSAKVLWDDTYLYFLADVSDNQLVNESTNIYDDDGVEFYVDINNDKATSYGANDFQYTFAWDNGTVVGVLPSGRSTAGITYAAVARTGGYIVEAQIPWTTLQGSPAIGQLIGIDFMINDDDNGGVRDKKLSWNAGTDDAWQDPSLFGTAILQGLLPCTTPAPPQVTAKLIYCQKDEASALSATGTGLLWYTSASGGTGTTTAPVPSTTLVGTTQYYVSQNDGGCESDRELIEVVVNALPDATITPSGPTTFVSGNNVVLQATSGSGWTYQWYKDGTAVATGESYTVTESGTYMVEVTNAAECKAVSQRIQVTVNPNQPSVITLVSPVHNAVVEGPVTITAEVSDPDGEIVLVEFLDGTEVIGSSTTAPYSIVWNNPGPGEHSIIVRVTDSNGGITTSTSTAITSGSVTGLKSLMVINAQVYPNPACNELYIEAQVDLTNASYSLVDVLGKEVLQHYEVTGTGAKIDVSGLQDGFYVLCIKNEDSVLQKKITIKR